MTPAQLRAFAAVVRQGSVKAAAADLAVSDAAVSMHIGQLRKELGDRLFTRTAAGLAFTPGGLRLAGRAAELLGLQDRTILEVSQAGTGRRLLRLAATSLFAEHCAPGLIEQFADRADDLDVELSIHPPAQFVSLVRSRTVDVAIGPRPPVLDDAVICKSMLNYTVLAVAAARDVITHGTPSTRELRERTWLLGPSVATDQGSGADLMRRLNVPDAHQQIFQSHAAALEEAKRGKGIALALSFAVTQDLARGDLQPVTAPITRAQGSWNMISLHPRDAAPAASEFIRFVRTPRAMQAMLRGPGVTIGRFRPSIHVTLWG